MPQDAEVLEDLQIIYLVGELIHLSLTPTLHIQSGW